MYKRNASSVDLHRPKRISSNFDTEVQIIKSKFKSVGYPLPFIDNVIRTFKEKNIVDQNNATDGNDDELLIPPYFFEVNKSFILLKLPFSQNNEIKSKHFLKKFHHFTKNNFDITISWETRKIQTLFHLKDKKLYPACKIYYGICECGEDYIGKTKRNTITRWSEHDNVTKDSEPSRHLRKHISHALTWRILCHASKKTDIRKNLEEIIIALLKTSLNKQKNFERLILFRNGIT